MRKLFFSSENFKKHNSIKKNNYFFSNNPFNRKIIQLNQLKFKLLYF